MRSTILYCACIVPLFSWTLLDSFAVLFTAHNSYNFHTAQYHFKQGLDAIGKHKKHKNNILCQKVAKVAQAKVVAAVLVLIVVVVVVVSIIN